MRQRNADREPPWAAADFSPERAWRLICNLRADLARVRAERDRLRAGVEVVDIAAVVRTNQRAKQRDWDGRWE